jgi:hypothetical protein
MGRDGGVAWIDTHVWRMKAKREKYNLLIQCVKSRFANREKCTPPGERPARECE